MTARKILAGVIVLIMLSTASYAIPLTKDNTDKSKLPNLYSIKNPKRPKNNPNAESETRTIIGLGRDPQIISPVFAVMGDIMRLAHNILIYNSPVFGKKQTIKNFQGIPNSTAEIKKKVCTKNKTIAAGIGDIKVNGQPYIPDGSVKFFPFVLITASPEYTFTGQVKIGRKMSDVKAYLMEDLDDNYMQVIDEPGHLSFRSASMSLDFLYENGIITQISFHQPTYAHFQGLKINTTFNFIKTKAREMGLTYLY